MTKKDLKFGIRYLQLLLYRARSFVSGVKRSYKASEEAQAFAKATGAEKHPSKQQYDHRPRGKPGGKE